MSRVIHLLGGENVTVDGECEIITLLGSCVTVLITDYERGVAGMTHYLLPHAPSGDTGGNRYGQSAIANLVSSVYDLGSLHSKLQARIYGGADVLKNVDLGHGVGRGNVAIAYEVLMELGIAVMDANVGGIHARRIRIHVPSFQIVHELIGSPQKSRGKTRAG